MRVVWVRAKSGAHNLHFAIILDFSSHHLRRPHFSTMNWDDTPAPRKPLPEDVPPPTRAFLSQFNRSFTPPALINDPYALDRKLVISSLLVGPRSLFIPRNPYAVDPAIER